MKTRRRWTTEELLIALNLYHKLTFGQKHARQPLIIEVAKKLGRSPNSLAMKLVNFASLDPILKLRGISGLSGASHLDQEFWDQFHANPETMVAASEEALRQLYEAPEDAELEFLPKQGIRIKKSQTLFLTEKIQSVKARRGQEYFREAVLNNFSGQCGVSKLDIRRLLIASHILPWAFNQKERLNVANGLCLSRLHDAAFDQGLIAFNDSMQLLLSPQLKSALAREAVENFFGRYEKQPLHLSSEAVCPEPEFLAWHRVNVFQNVA